MLFIILYKVIVTFESMDELLKCDYESYSVETVYFPLMLFIMEQKVVLPFEYVD